MKSDKTCCVLGKFACLALALTTAHSPVFAGPADPALSAKSGYEGRIRLAYFLDEPDGYCLDVPGPVQNLFLESPTVAHTCHPDPLGDQVFRFNVEGQGLINWRYGEHDLCLTALAAEPKSKLKLLACDNPSAQQFRYTDKGEFQLQSTSLCVQVERTGPASRQQPSSGQDAYGRGRSVNAQYTHLMRFLELHPCGSGDPAMARWRALERN
ncbi:MAG: ricin-type beta-trefoil lectin domain protein [Pseudomonadota bacterium]